MKAHIVVGCGYGDEGKGLTTDYLCTQHHNPIVVRFSGGAQAGHTVKIGDKIHTHSNFGAGTLRGFPSYFSEHTCIYPITIERERFILKEKGIEPKLIIHPLAMVTTPFDRYANRRDRENGDHGTCGLGIGKTMERSLESPVKLYAIDLTNMDVVINKMASIAEYYGYIVYDSWLQEELNEFYEAVKNMSITIADYLYLKQFSNLIFEGSQGILLDMDHGVFPNVTYANTTSKNAQEICDKLKIDLRTVYHVTRAYSTRHGSGFFEERPIELKNNEDENNVFNIWQKEFKVAPLNYDMLNYAISIENIYSDECRKVLVITCNDQVEEPFDMSKLKRGYDNVIKSYSSDGTKIQIHSRFNSKMFN